MYALVAVAALVLGACAAPPSSSDSEPAADRPAVPAPVAGPPAGQGPPAGGSGETVRFDARVTYLPIEGGAWVLRADDGTTYQPLGLGQAFQEEGLRVRVEARLQTDVASTLQVGTIVRVVSVRRI